MQSDTIVNLVMLYKMLLNTIYSKVWVSRHVSYSDILHILQSKGFSHCFRICHQRS